MKNLKTIRREASGVVTAVSRPLGARSLQRVISEHLDFFAGLRAEGASWEQIGALMASEGLRSRADGVVSAGVLRALYSRAARRPQPATCSEEATVSQVNFEGLTSLPGRAAAESTGSLALAERLERAMRLRGPISERD